LGRGFSHRILEIINSIEKAKMFFSTLQTFLLFHWASARVKNLPMGHKCPDGQTKQMPFVYLVGILS
jgi:hypothetical protein